MIMTNQDKIKTLRSKIDEAEVIIVGAASGMSAASGFEFYYKDDEVFRSIAGGLADKYGLTSSFAAYYDKRVTREEWWAMNIRFIKYIYECYTGETYKDLYELLHGKEYYIVTTNQDAQFYRLFPEDRITRLQGDWRYFQCSRCCHDQIYYNRDIVNNLYDKIVDDKLPDSLIPRCPKCGADMEPWVRGPKFLQGKFYDAELKRYLDYLGNCTSKKTLFLELGVGMMTPMFIKEPFMNMTFQWPDAFYATINPQHAIIPKEIADKSIAIDDDILKVLKELLGKPTDSIRQFDKNNVFDPSKI